MEISLAFVKPVFLKSISADFEAVPEVVAECMDKNIFLFVRNTESRDK
jgi:hypothetical protein